MRQEEEHEEQAHEARAGTRSKNIKRQEQEASTRTQEARAKSRRNAKQEQGCFNVGKGTVSWYHNIVS